MKITDILLGAEKIINEELLHQIREQGHPLTGALEASVNGVISGDTLYGEAKAYLKTLETGIPAEKIVINSQTLDEMTRYVELRMGYRGSKAQNVAYQILRKQQRFGNPTPGSYAYSNTGERKGAITITFKNKERELDTHMRHGIDELINAEFHRQKSETI